MCLVILFLQDIMYFEQVVFFTHIPEKKVDILVRTNLKYTQTKCTHFRPFSLVVVYSHLPQQGRDTVLGLGGDHSLAVWA